MTFKEEIKMLEEFKRNLNFISENRKYLTKRCPNSFVAILNQRLIDYDNNFEKLMNRLRSNYSDNELTVMAIEFIPDEQLSIYLSELYEV